MPELIADVKLAEAQKAREEMYAKFVALRTEAEQLRRQVEAVRDQMLDWEKRHRMGDRSRIDLFWAANAIRAALGPAALDGEEGS